MADDVLPQSRSERLTARRRRRYRWAGALAVVGIAGGAATVAAAFADPQPTEPPREEQLAVRGGFDTDERLPELREFGAQEQGRPLSYEDPLRVWVGGDSLAGAFGPALGEMGQSTGVVATDVDYKISSGLVNGSRNWPSYAADAMAEHDPEVVVFMIGANDTSIVSSHDADGDGVADWEPGYRADVGAMMDLFLAGTTEPRTLVWIGSPTLRDGSMARGARELNRVMREEADARDGVLYVDAYRLFAGPDGEYAATITDDQGETIRVRIGDGVHLTPKGAEYLARAIFALLDARFRLVEQTDPEHAIRYTVRHGGYDDGSDDDGGSSGGGSGSRTGSGRTATTAPPTTVAAPTTVVTVTTAPPTTVAPTSVPVATSIPTPTTAPTPTTGPAPAGGAAAGPEGEG